MVRGAFITSPLGANLAPWGELCPLGGMFTPRGEHYCFEEWRGKQRISPAEDNFTPREPIHPWGQNLSLGAKLRIGLWFSFRHVQLVPHLLETVLVSIQACSAGSCLFVFRHVQLVPDLLPAPDTDPVRRGQQGRGPLLAHQQRQKRNRD
jgi:hypothetical protein